MNPILSLATQPWAQTLGWTLLHFLWQGVALGLLAWVSLLLLRGASAKARYGAACACLVLMVAAPLVTFILLQPQAATRTLTTLSVEATGGSALATPLAQRLKLSLDPSLPWLLLVWAAGVLLLSVRFLGSWIVVQRLRRRSATPVPAEWHLVLSRLCRELKLSRTVRMLQSAAVEVPTALGWLRPIILLPACAFSGLSALQLEAILAHELAHIRRGDFLVNLLQSLVEVLLFYHPAVWWLSSRIRAERELCCDDVAAALCGDPLLLAHALTDLEALRPVQSPSSARLALAATGGSLMHRIRHLLQPALPVSSGARGTALALLAASLLGAAGVALQDKDTAPKPPAPPKVKAEEKRELKVSRKGDVTLNGEAPEPVTVGADGSFSVEETKAGKSRSYKATKDSATYTLNGQVTALDAEGKEWLRGIIRDLKQQQGGPRQVREIRIHKGEAGAEGEDKDIQVIVKDHEGHMSSEDRAKLKAEVAKAVAEAKKAHAEGMGAKAEADHARMEAEAIKNDPELQALIENAKKEGKQIRVKVVKQADGQPATIDIEGEPHQKQIIVNRLHKGEGSEGHDVQILEPSDLPKDAEGKPLRIRVPRVRVETHVIHGSEDPKAELAELQAEMKALQTRMEHLQKQMALAPLTPKGSKDKVPPPPPMPPPPPPAPPAPPVPEAPRATPAH